MNLTLKNNTDLDIEIEDLSSFLLTASGTEIITNYFSTLELAQSNDLINYIATEDITVTNDVEELTPTIAIKTLLGSLSEIKITDELRDRSGKIRVHQTSRKIGTAICWTGEGDDSTNPSSVGGGNSFSFSYYVGQEEPLTRHIDFNVIENETWLHEGYITWKNCYLDTLDLQVVPRLTSYTISSGTNYNLYGGYLIVPSTPGHGTINITSDITTHSGGLVFMPPNDLGEQPVAYFDADWNPATKRYENITPNYTGQGKFNMFIIEVTLAHFVRKMPLLNSGFIALNSSDTDQLGAGMRLKMIADTNTTVSGVGDHDWSLACTMCLHREKTT